MGMISDGEGGASADAQQDAGLSTESQLLCWLPPKFGALHVPTGQPVSQRLVRDSCYQAAKLRESGARLLGTSFPFLPGSHGEAGLKRKP